MIIRAYPSPTTNKQFLKNKQIQTKFKTTQNVV